MEFEYDIMSFDPVTSDGVCRGTDACVEKLNAKAREDWSVSVQWVHPETGVWFFLLVRMPLPEKDDHGV